MGFIGKLLMFVVKILSLAFALLLATAFISTKLPADFLPYISLLGLFIPFLIIINVVSLLFWVFTFRIFFVVPLAALLIGINQWGHLFAYNNQASDLEQIENPLKVMSFNGRLFNKWEFIKDENIPARIEAMIAEYDPDVICFQEYSPGIIDLPQYKHRYVVLRGEKKRYGDAIYSKFPIIEKGNLDFQRSFNNTIWTDIRLPQRRVVRIYNGHFQSMGLNLEEVRDPNLPIDQQKKKIENLADKTNAGFLRQSAQAQIVRIHMDDCPYPKILMCDMNNTAFSNTFDILTAEDMTDCFSERGKGFGRTFRPFVLCPLRIDFILADKEKFDVHYFRTIDEKLSDHNAVMSVVSLR